MLPRLREWLARLPQLARALALARRYRVVLAVFVASTLLATAVFTLRQERLYRAEALVELRWYPGASRFPFEDPGSQAQSTYWSFDEFRNTQVAVLRSSRVAERVSAMLGGNPTAAAIQGRVEVAPVPSSHLVRVRVVDADPDRAANVVNTVVETYIEVGIETRMAWVGDLVDWLGDRIREIQTEIRAGERSLLEFQRDARTLDPVRDRTQAQSEVESLQAQFLVARTTRLREEGRWRQMQTYVERGDAGLAELASTLGGDAVDHVRRSLAAALEQRAELAAVYGPEHPRMLAAQARVEVLETRLLDAARDSVTAARTRWDLARAEEERLGEAIEARIDGLLERTEQQIRFGELRDRTGTARELYEVMLQRAKEVDLSRDFRREQAVVIERARVPVAPFRPNLMLNMSMGLLLALLGGGGLVLGLSLLQPVIQNADDLEAATGLVALAEIPELPADAVVVPERLMLRDPDHPAAETFRGLRNRLLFSPRRVDIRVTMVSGAFPGEGKTSVISNLAVATARAGRRVLMVDADLHRFGLTRLWAHPDDPGLGQLLRGEADPVAVIQSTEVPQLHILPVGAETGEDELLTDVAALRALLEGLRADFDTIFFDAGPLLRVAAPLPVAAVVDEVLLVLAAGQITRGDVAELRTALRQVGRESVEVVLNRVRIPSGRFAAGGYGSQYADLRAQAIVERDAAP